MTEKWNESTIGNIGRVVTGKTPPTSDPENYGGTLPFITPSDMKGQKFIGSTERTISVKGIKHVKNLLIPQKTVFVSCIGSDMGKVGMTTVESVTNQQINAVIVNEGVDTNYVYYNLFARKDELQRLATSGSAQPILNKGHFSQLKIEIPPLPEQKAIASILGALDDKIEMNRKMNETLEAMARAVFKSWFVDFLPVRAKMAAANKHVPSLPAAKEGQWFVYALECEDGSFYIGYTEDLQQRWQQHVCGKGAQWTKAHPPIRIAHCETLSSQQEAVKREKWLKTGFGRKWLKRQVVANARTQTGDPIPLPAPSGARQAGGLGPHKEWQESALGRIPKGWTASTIGEEVKVVGGSTPSTQEPSYWKDGAISWATPKDLSLLSSPVLLQTERHITEKGLQQISSGLLPRGTVLLSSRAPIGYLAISEVPVAVNQGFIAMICAQELPNHYVLHWAKDNIDIIEGRANGTTFLEISKRNFRPITIIVPPLQVLQVFNQHAEGLYQRIVNNLKESHTLAFTRDTLLPKLLSGEIRVKNAERFLERL